MSDIALQVEGLSKQYRIGARQERYRTFRDAAAGVFSRRSAQKGGRKKETIWALKDVAFEVKRGDIVGIIGKNGSGKSTLLKLLSRITDPTLGSAEIYGRVGSLLEVGTGFHPELTGRDNVYLNGAILGMRRAEIASKFDEIVAFAEVERFIDTPVKHYSSGMYLRLAFAVAAYLDPEILLVDEVLAVGDTTFQKRCMSRMQDISSSGRTILFVSHNLTAIRDLCTTAVLLDAGEVQAIGDPCQIIADYQGSDTVSQSFQLGVKTGPACVTSGRILGSHILSFNDFIDIEVEVYSAQDLRVNLQWRISDEMGRGVSVGVSQIQLGRFQHLKAGANKLRISIGPLPLFAGKYTVSFEIMQAGVSLVDKTDDVLSFEIAQCDPEGVGASLLSRWAAGSTVIPYSLECVPTENATGVIESSR